jgi:hypothetical protein
MQNDEWRIRLRTARLRRDKEGGKGPVTTWDSSTLNTENSALCAATRRMKKSGALDAAEDRGNFARGRAQALALCAQDRIQRSIVRVWS